MASCRADNTAAASPIAAAESLVPVQTGSFLCHIDNWHHGFMVGLTGHHKNLRPGAAPIIGRTD